MKRLFSNGHALLSLAAAAAFAIGCGGAVASPISGDPSQPGGQPGGSDPNGGAPRPPVACSNDPKVETLASAQAIASGLAINGSSVFFSDGIGNPATARVSKAGGSVSQIASTGRVVAATDTDAIIVTGGGNAADFGLLRVPLDGSAPTTLVANTTMIGSVVIDASNVYWSTNGEIGDCFGNDCPSNAPALFSVPLAGGNVATLASGVGADMIAIDDTYIYWASEVPSDVPVAKTAIAKVPKAGGAATAIFIGTANTFIADFKADADNLYWVQSDLQDVAPTAIMSVSKSGGAPSLVVTPANHFNGPIAAFGASLFWVDDPSSSIMTVAKTGGAPAVAAADGVTSGSVGALLADASGLYWTAGVACGAMCNGSVLHLAPKCP